MISFIITSMLSLFLFFSPVQSIAYNKELKENHAPNRGEESLIKKIAHAYGINSFSKIKTIEYTFNVSVNGKKFSRKWLWNPNTNEVTFWGKDKKGNEVHTSYYKNKPLDFYTKKINEAFINDNYWLMFPFHLVWDTSITVTDLGMKRYPINRGAGELLEVKYSKNSDSSPGDEFDLYLNNKYEISEWIYKQGGSSKNEFPATWESVKNYKGVLISTVHNGPGNKFKIWFSGIKIVLK